MLTTRERSIGGPPIAEYDATFLADLDRRYRVPLIRYFGKRIREAYDVDDLVQEVFIRLVRQATIESVEQIDSYVFQTAANVIRDRARRHAARHHREHDELSESDLPTNDLSPERVLLGTEQLARAVAALEELPENTRRVFVLRRYEGMRHEQIAAHLGISVSGVRFHMEKAKAHLARRLEQSQ
jgi:RNA polymerase sigma factor (sigma-70 family)